MRTLLSVYAGLTPLYAILNPESQPHKRIPYDRAADTARAAGANEYCIGIFDFDPDSETFDRLYDQADLMG